MGVTNRALDQGDGSASQLNAGFYSLSRLVRQGLQVLALSVGAALVLAGDLSGGVVFAGSLLVGKTLAPVEQLISGWKGISQAREAYAANQELLEKSKERVEPITLPEPAGRLAVEELSYSPNPESPRPLFANISFTVEPGEILAVVSRSGAGKSTLPRLIVGAIPPTEGTIRIDGIDLNQWSFEQRGRAIGYVPQDILLFPGTVAENISRLALEVEDQLITDAAIAAHAYEMIAGLPDAYNTVIGPDRMPLSGG